MSRWIQIIRGVSMAIVTIGLLFKLLYWPWGLEIMLAGMTLWVLYIGISMVDLLQRRKKMKVISFFRQIIGQLGISFLLFSFFVPMVRLPGQKILLYLGIGCGSIYGILLFFARADEDDFSEEESLIDQIGKD